MSKAVKPTIKPVDIENYYKCTQGIKFPVQVDASIDNLVYEGKETVTVFFTFDSKYATEIDILNSKKTTLRVNDLGTVILMCMIEMDYLIKEITGEYAVCE